MNDFFNIAITLVVIFIATKMITGMFKLLGLIILFGAMFYLFREPILSVVGPYLNEVQDLIPNLPYLSDLHF